MKYLTLFIFLLSFNVYADKCDSKTKSDLLKEANLIKVDYDEIEETEEINDGYNKYTAINRKINISLYNLTDNFSLEIINSYNDNVIYAENTEYKDGKYTFNDLDAYKVINYQIKVYNNTSCDRYLIKTVNYTKPMYNSNFNYAICKENTSVPYCQKYITNQKYIFDAGKGLDKAIDDYKNNRILITEDDNESFIKKYYIYFIIGFILISGSIVTIVLINKKRSEI